MTTLTDVSADGKLQAKYLDDRRGVLLRAQFQEALLNIWDFEPLGTPVVYPSGGVFPKIRSSDGAITSTSTSTSLIVPLPSGWQVGDLCYISWSMLVTSAALTPPAGWANVFTAVNANGVTNVLHGVFKRVLQAGDTAPTLTWATGGKVAAVSMAIYDYDTTTNEDVVAVTDTNSGVVAPFVRAPSITPVTNGCLLITSFGVRNGTSGVTNLTFSTAPGMTEVREKYSALSNATNIGIAVDQQQLGTPSATGTKTSTVSGSNVTSLNQVGSAIVVRPKTATASVINVSGGFAWKNTTMLGPHMLYYNSPGSAYPELQWCGTIFKSTGTPITIDSSVAPVTSASGSAVTASFNVPVNTMVVAMIGYNGAATDAAGDKITVTNNKSLSVIKAVERGHLEDANSRGGAVIAYMYSSGAQTGMTVTATLAGINASFDDIALKVILLGNVDSANPIPDGVTEGSRITTTNNPVLKINAATIAQGLAVWVANDALNLGAPTLSDAMWTATYGTVAKTATTPISGQNSMLNTWTTNQLGVRHTFNTQEYKYGPKLIRFAFKILGTETINPAFPKNQKARLEVKFYNGTVVIGTCVTGFPSNVLRSWYVDFFIPKGQKVTKIEIVGFGWDTSAAARFDEFKITERVPPYIQFIRKTDGGFIRGGDPAQAVQGVAYAYDDELTFGQDTQWYAEPVFSNGVIGAATGTVHFVIEDRDPSVPSTMIKSVENPGLRLYLATDQRDITRGRSTTFVNKQTGGKPTGGVNSAYSAAGDYMLITQTIAEMQVLETILADTVLYISPTGRYHRPPFYATAKGYTILDFATMDSPYKIFSVDFQEVERPDTAWQPSFLPLNDYGWLSTQYATYGDSSLIVQTYDQLAFASVT